jgi:murein L,D-transpeptidase YcbB/YkuD
MRRGSRLACGLLAGFVAAGSALAQTETNASEPDKAAIPAVSAAAEPSSVPPAAPPTEQTSPAQKAVAGGDDPSSRTPPLEDAIGAEMLRQLAASAGLASPEERAALTAFYESRARQPLWVTSRGLSARAEQIIAEIKRADDWGLNAADFPLPAPAMTIAANSEVTTAELATAELKLDLAVLKYARQARGGRMDPSALSNYIDRKPSLLEPTAVIEQIAKADAPDAYLRGLHPQHPQFERLRQAYLALRGGKPPLTAGAAEEGTTSNKSKRKAPAAPEAVTERKLLHNLEQWRWMPGSLGETFVWVNIPEFTLRVVKNGNELHAERVVTGQTDTQTPIFSDEMETIVFHPYWGVPDSIKVKEILPGLMRGGGLLERNGLRVQHDGRDIDPNEVDWSTVDIRNFHVYQPPGGGNVLGVVKFVFPNKHQVYMHDTPTKNLFNATQRTFSHGCMRVRNPVRLAEVLLGEDKGWEPKKIAALVKNGPQDNHVQLTKKIPVHITYFTAWVDEAGKLHTRPDVYGHESRIQMGLDGKAHLIVKRKEDLGPARGEVVGRLAEAKSSWTRRDWMRDVFGNAVNN